MQKITPFLWFDDQAEAAVDFYVSIFPNSKKGAVALYGEDTPGEAGSVMTVSFELNGQAFTALNGGPVFKFNEAVSFQIDCADQAEVDYYWDALVAGGGAHDHCGWLKDRFGLSWQVVPAVLFDLIRGADKAGSDRAAQAMLTMEKLDIATLQAAYKG